MRSRKAAEKEAAPLFYAARAARKQTPTTRSPAPLHVRERRRCSRRQRRDCFAARASDATRNCWVPRLDVDASASLIAPRGRSTTASSGPRLSGAARVGHAPVVFAPQAYRPHRRRLRRDRRVPGAPASRAGAPGALGSGWLRFVPEEVPGTGAQPFSEHSNGALTNAPTFSPARRTSSSLVPAAGEMGSYARRYASC